MNPNADSARAPGPGKGQLQRFCERAGRGLELFRQELEGVHLLYAQDLERPAARSLAELAETGRQLARLLEENPAGAPLHNRAFVQAGVELLGRFDPANPKALGVNEALDCAATLLGALEAAFARLQRGPCKSAAYTRKKSLRVLAALCAVAALAGAVAFGPAGWKLAMGALNEHRSAQAREAMERISQLAVQAKMATGKSLVQITGSDCTRCACQKDKFLWQEPKGSECRTRWEKAIAAIYTAATRKHDTPPELLADPWGAPYLLIENEQERPGDCSRDELRSAGPDGIADTPDDVVKTIPNVHCGR